MTETMLTRMARGMYEADQFVNCGHEWDREPKRHEPYIKMAKAALEAIRGGGNFGQVALVMSGNELSWDADEEVASRVWTAMIDAILQGEA